MFKWAARFFLLRVLPRRLLPIVTVVEALLLLRSVRKRSGQVRVNEPSESRTAPPEPVQPARATGATPPPRSPR